MKNPGEPGNNQRKWHKRNNRAEQSTRNHQPLWRQRPRHGNRIWCRTGGAIGALANLRPFAMASVMMPAIHVHPHAPAAQAPHTHA